MNRISNFNKPLTYLYSFFPLLCILAWLSPIAIAQNRITSDETLDGERSITTSETIRGLESDRISGGARRGANLFHSFSEFSIGENRGAYFDNPTGVENILTRVTGGVRSDILGTLGVLGDANLFLMNPNGMIFGPSARLDVRGSFVGTTASAIGFGALGEFSATSPEAPALLTINPSAFFFQQVNPQNLPSITNQANVGAGLLAGRGQNLVLLGGNVINDGGILASVGGRIKIASVAGSGIVSVRSDSLEFPDDLARGDVSFTNQSQMIGIAQNNSGSFAIIGRNIDIAGQSQLGVEVNPRISAAGRAGDIILNATDTVQIREGSRVLNIVGRDGVGDAGDIQINARSLLMSNDARLSTTTFGQGDAGNIFIRAQGLVSLDSGATIFGGPIEATGEGSGGTVRITAGTFSMSGGSRLTTYVEGKGNAGDISIEAQGQVLLSEDSAVRNYVQEGGIGNSGNTDINASSLTIDGGANIDSGVQLGGIGNSGNTRINTRSFSLTNNAFIRNYATAQGEAGSILINSSDQVLINRDAEIFSFVADGRGGSIGIRSQSVSFDGGSLQTSTFGRGDAGDISIEASERLVLNPRSGILSITSSESAGNGGDIQIRAGLFEIIGDGVRVFEDRGIGSSTGIFIETSGQGNSGNFSANIQNQTLVTDGGVIVSKVNRDSEGDAGDIQIDTGSLVVRDFSALQASTEGRGNAGNILINARNGILFEGGIADSPLRSGARSDILSGAEGNGGNIDITTNSLIVRDRALISTSVFGRGDAGNVTINAQNVVFDNGLTLTTVGSPGGQAGNGRGGDIRLTTGSLSLLNGGQLDASTFSQGDSGNVIVSARDRIILDGISSFRDIAGNPRASTLFTEVVAGAAGNGGDVIVDTGDLIATNGGRLEASTEGRGDAGSVIINARGLVWLDGTSPREELTSGILSNVVTNAVGDGGDIRINAANLRVTNGAQLDASTEGIGDAGSIVIRASGRVVFNGVSSGGQFSSTAFTRVDRGAVGNAGSLNIATGSLSITNGAALQAATLGEGNAGSIIIEARERVAVDGFNDLAIGTLDSGGTLFRRFVSSISSDVAQGAIGQGGDIRITTPLLVLTNGSNVGASLSGRGTAGSIRIQASDRVVLRDEATITTSTAGQGNAGNLLINTNAATVQGGYIRSAIEAGGRGEAGNITLRAEALTLRDGGQIIAGVLRPRGSQPGGSGNGGNITIRADDRIQIHGFDRNGIASGILTLTERATAGRSGTITLRTRDFEIADGAIVTASTFNDRNAGAITINADAFRASGGGQIVTNTRARGQAGTIRLNIRDQVLLSGSDPNFVDRRNRIQRFVAQANQGDQLGDVLLTQGSASGLYANTAPSSIGNGGNIFINTETLMVQDSARVTVNSQGAGQGGNILVGARNSYLNNRAQISAETTSTNGGNLTFNIGNNLILDDRSTITTNAGTQSRLVDTSSRVSDGSANTISGGNLTFNIGNALVLRDRSTISTNSNGNGGNIAINTPAIVAVPTENSNITANAIAGNGGNVQLNATLYGINVANQETTNSDITATSDRGVQGEINVTPPNVDPVQGLVELPDNILDVANQVDAACPQGRNASEELDRFVTTGRGGLPSNPVENLDTETVFTQWISATDDRTPASTLQSATAIVEAQGWVRGAGGQVTLVAEAPTPDRIATAIECQALRE